MARDRKRAKRRKRRSGTDGANPSQDRPSAPNPLEHSSAEVDEAKLAEMGAQPPAVGDSVERAPDQVEELGRDEEIYAEGDKQHKTGVFTFLGHVIDELRRVQWPTRREVGQGTGVTLGFVVIAGLYLWLLDLLWKPVLDLII